MFPVVFLYAPAMIMGKSCLETFKTQISWVKPGTKNTEVPWSKNKDLGHWGLLHNFDHSWIFLAHTHKATAESLGDHWSGLTPGSPPSMVTAEARDGVDTKMLEVGLRNGAAAREPAGTSVGGTSHGMFRRSDCAYQASKTSMFHNSSAIFWLRTT